MTLQQRETFVINLNKAADSEKDKLDFEIDLKALEER